MVRKAQHAQTYAALPPFLRKTREEAGLTQRALGDRLHKAQSWVFNCESGNRRVDVTEFIAWCAACDVSPHDGFKQLLQGVKLPPHAPWQE